MATRSARPQMDVGLILTYKCQSACRHCLYNCGPGWIDWMEPDEIRTALQIVKSFDNQTQIHITGGEPFLNFSLLLKTVEIYERVNSLAQDIQKKIAAAQLESIEVVTSNHQSELCQWLGLEVVSTFAGRDVETFSNISDIINKTKDRDIRFVISNKPEGTGLADTLAEQLNAEVIVFGNFPEGSGSNLSFDKLLLSNVNTLIEASKI